MPPCNETVIWSKLKAVLTPGLAVLLTPDTIKKFGYSVAHVLVTIDEKNPCGQIRILNPYPMTKTVPENIKIAVAERLEIVDNIIQPSTPKLVLSKSYNLEFDSSHHVTLFSCSILQLHISGKGKARIAVPAIGIL